MLLFGIGNNECSRGVCNDARSRIYMLHVVMITWQQHVKTGQIS